MESVNCFVKSVKKHFLLYLGSILIIVPDILRLFGDEFREVRLAGTIMFVLGILLSELIQDNKTDTAIGQHDRIWSDITELKKHTGMLPK